MTRDITFDGTDDFHLAEFRRHSAEAQRLVRQLPPTCYGAIRVAGMAQDALGSAFAHVWAVSGEQRATVSVQIGELNRTERVLADAVRDMADQCGGTTTRWRRAPTSPPRHFRRTRQQRATARRALTRLVQFD